MLIDWLPAGKLLSRIELLQQRLPLQVRVAQGKERGNEFSVQKGMWRNG